MYFRFTDCHSACLRYFLPLCIVARVSGQTHRKVGTQSLRSKGTMPTTAGLPAQDVSRSPSAGPTRAVVDTRIPTAFDVIATVSSSVAHSPPLQIYVV